MNLLFQTELKPYCALFYSPGCYLIRWINRALGQVTRSTCWSGWSITSIFSCMLLMEDSRTVLRQVGQRSTLLSDHPDWFISRGNPQSKCLHRPISSKWIVAETWLCSEKAMRLMCRSDVCSDCFSSLHPLFITCHQDSLDDKDKD